MLLGVVGIVVGLLLFLGWRNSTDRLQKTVAWFGAILAGASVLLVVVGLLLAAFAGR